MLVYAVKKMRSGSAGLSKAERKISVWFGFRGEEDGVLRGIFSSWKALLKAHGTMGWHRVAQGGRFCSYAVGTAVSVCLFLSPCHPLLLPPF